MKTIIKVLIGCVLIVITVACAAVPPLLSRFRTCPDIVFLYDGSVTDARNILMANIGRIVEDLNSRESFPFANYYSTEIAIFPERSGERYCIKINIDYIGGGGLLVWSIKDRFTRSVQVNLIGKSPHTEVRVCDCISKNADKFTRTHSFADVAVPFLYAKRDADIELMYDNGRTYAKGKLQDGLREGEWIWFDKTGEVIQKATYISGIVDGTLLIRWKGSDGYIEKTFGNSADQD